MEPLNLPDTGQKRPTGAEGGPSVGRLEACVWSLQWMGQGTGGVELSPAWTEAGWAGPGPQTLVGGDRGRGGPGFLGSDTSIEDGGRREIKAERRLKDREGDMLP